jgi:hypothetical protein
MPNVNENHDLINIKQAIARRIYGDRPQFRCSGDK